MKEKFEQFIVKSKQFLMESELYKQADKISFVCQITPYDQFQLAMLMTSGIMTKPDINKEVLIFPIHQDAIEPITVDEFKHFMTDYFQEHNPDLHIELIVPNAYYGFLFQTNGSVKTLEEVFELLDFSEKEDSWDWALSGGIGFRLVQDIVD